MWNIFSAIRNCVIGRDARVPNMEAQKNESPMEGSCGLGSFRPAWLQRLADPKAYLFLFCALGVLQGAYHTYTIGIMSTIEKRYAFDSKISGIILIADNLTPILTSLFIGYYGGRAHRPRLVALGMLFVCLSCLMSAIPYFVFGPGVDLLDSAGSSISNQTRYQTCGASGPGKECGSGRSSATLPAVTLFFVANFFNGFGGNAFYTAGISYLDDNISKRDSPVYFSTSMAIRLFGPSFGFFLSSICLRFYEDPRMNPNLSRRSPQWLGAWWMGYLIICAMLIVFTIPMFLFPKNLRKKVETTNQETNTELPKIKDMPRELLKLYRNKVFRYQLLGAIFHINGYAGYFILFPKYMEAHFRKSASEASLTSGYSGLLTMLLGILLGGLYMRKYKPRSSILTGYIAIIQLVCVLIMMSLMFLACPTTNLEFPVVDGRTSLTNECNAQCDCNTHLFQPVCGADQKSLYFSACHAGCTGISINETTNKTMFTDCSCTPSLDQPVNLISGFCPFECGLFVVYIAILCVGKFVSATGRVGNALITLRCVEPEQKTLALGVTSCVFCIFVFIPYPLVFGALVDSTCLVWEESCGRRGNCWLYDVDQFRLRAHGLAIGLIFIGVLCDFMVWWYSRSMPNIFDDAKPLPQDPAQLDKDLQPSGEEKNEVFILQPVSTYSHSVSQPPKS